ncbi:hypothetical protein Tco_1425610, partial [Tanacetum coccineum]
MEKIHRVPGHPREPPGSVPGSDHGLHVSANATDYKYDPKLSAVKDCSSREQSYKHQPTDKAVGTNVASNVRNNNDDDHRDKTPPDGESCVLFRCARVSKAVFSSSPELLPNSLE